MSPAYARLPALSYVLLAASLVGLAARSHNETTLALVVSSVLMFGFCLSSAAHLLGTGPALRFMALAVCLGWFAEQMGATRGWFFGEYDYTDVLGPRLGEVPVVIPMMWFALTYAGYVIANLIVSRTPVDNSPGTADVALLSFLSAMIVTAFDLGADPYLVFKLEAWVMVKKDGWWFGETIQGFFGWMFVSFVIIHAFRLWARRHPPQPAAPFLRRHAALPLLLYAGFMVFQMALGHPVETRTIAAFAMGIPLVCAVAGWRHWIMPQPRMAPPQAPPAARAATEGAQ
jgi:uncharacterized membrane protein